MVGCKLSLLTRHEFSWSFAFAGIATLTVEGPWRVRSADAVALSSPDDGQKFDLPAPVDIEARARQLIVGKTVRDIAAREGQGDLTIRLEDGLILEALNMSTGYEAWQVGKPQEATLISMGGGKLVFA